MIISENEEIAFQAIETLRYLFYGGTVDEAEEFIKVYEELEAYELCQGIALGIEYFKTKEFGCRIGNIRGYDEA